MTNKNKQEKLEEISKELGGLGFNEQDAEFLRKHNQVDTFYDLMNIAAENSRMYPEQEEGHIIQYKPSPKKFKVIAGAAIITLGYLISAGINSYKEARNFENEIFSQKGLLENYAKYPYDFGHKTDTLDVNSDGLDDILVTNIFEKPLFVELQNNDGSYDLTVARKDNNGKFLPIWDEVPLAKYKISRNRSLGSE